MSILNVNIVGIPDGTYQTIIQRDSDGVIQFNDLATYNNKTSSFNFPSIEVGTYLSGIVFDNNLPHSECSGIGGYTQ